MREDPLAASRLITPTGANEVVARRPAGFNHAAHTLSMFKNDESYNAAVKGFWVAAILFVLIACAFLCGIGSGRIVG